MVHHGHRVKVHAVAIVLPRKNFWRGIVWCAKDTARGMRIVDTVVEKRKRIAMYIQPSSPVVSALRPEGKLVSEEWIFIQLIWEDVGYTKVGKNYMPSFVDENIFRFDIAMDNPQVVKSLCGKNLK